MKKLFTILMLIIIGSSVFADGSPRKVLWEQFTNTSCAPCAGFNPQAEAYWSENEDILVPIAYHVWWPGNNDPMYQNNVPEQQWRTNYYGCNSVPWTTINGNKFNTNPNMGTIQGVVESEAQVTSPFTVNLSHVKSDDGTTVTVTMEIECTEAITSDMLAYIAIIEKQIEFASPPGNNGETVFNHVFKKYLPDNDGTALPASMNIGDIFTIEETWTIEGFYNDMMLGVVGFIQNTGDKYIQQAAYSAPIGPDIIDVLAKQIIDPQDIICGNSINPRVKVQNNGGIELTSFDIEYSVNGGDVSTFSWTGNIPFLSSAVIDLPEISADMNETNNILSVTITNPNGEDDANPDNNTITKEFSSPVSAETVIMTSYLGSQYAEELSWKLYDPLGNIVAEDNYSSSNNGETVEETFTLTETGCYDFVWYDSYGDGFNGGGWCTLSINGEEFANFNSFGSEIATPWFAQIGDILEGPVNPSATINDYLISFTWESPSKATLLGYNIYEATDMDNPINTEVITETSYEYTVDNNGFYEFYFTAVYEEGESDIVGPVEVSITVGISSIENNSLSFYPNPVQDMLYIKYKLGNDAQVKAIIYSISGSELIHLESQSQMQGEQHLDINTSSLESGIYFLNLEINGETTIHKFSVM